MEFVTFHTGFWDDTYVLSLTPAERSMFIYCITGPDFVSGHSVAERNPILWPIRLGLPMSEIDTILQKLMADGKVDIENGVVWTINGIAYQRLRGLNLKISLQRIENNYRDKAPSLVHKCLSRYGVDTPYPPGVDPVPTGYPRGGTYQIRSDQIRSDHNNPPPADAGVAAVAADDKPLTAPQEALLPLVSQIKDLMAKAGEIHSLGKIPVNEERKCAVTVEQVIRLDGVPKDDLLPLVRWLLWIEQDGDSVRSLPGTPTFDWRGLLLSIPQWRKVSTNGRPKIVNAHQAWLKSRKQSNLSEYINPDAGLVMVH